jgi:hydroxyacylglutathione hydrolase
MNAKELARRLNRKNPPAVIDVRSTPEYRSGHIPGAVHVPFWGLLLHKGRLPSDRQASLVVTCEHGPRAQLAAAQLGVLGYRQVELLDGHMAGWREAGRSTEKSA